MEFIEKVRNEVMLWFGRYADKDLELDEEAWDRMEEYWEYCIIEGFEDRLKDQTPEEWWKSEGRDYTRKAVRHFAREIDSEHPTTDDIDRAFEVAKAKMNSILRRLDAKLGKITAPVICEADRD